MSVAISRRVCIPLVLVASTPLAAQRTPPSLRGIIVGAESGQPLGYSIVELKPHVGRQFTDAAGTFSFAGITAGTYLLTVRQIAYTPLDTLIVVREDTATVVNLALRHLAIELPPVAVTAAQCTTPGRPDSSDAALLAVFDQLQENARRYELLADSFPFRYMLEVSDRTVNQRGDTGKPEVQRIRFSSSDFRPYEVGRVVQPAWGPWGNPENVIVTYTGDLRDFGNADFIMNHCFRLMGADTIGADTLVRIDFEPGNRINTSDLAGSAYLDPTTYELRYIVTSLTRPERSMSPDVRSLRARTGFRNIAPGVPLQDSYTGITTYRYGRRAKIQTQRIFEVRFKREPPTP